MTPLNHMLKKWIDGYKDTKSLEKIYLQIAIFAKTKIIVDSNTSKNIYIQDTGIEFGIEKS